MKILQKIQSMFNIIKPKLNISNKKINIFQKFFISLKPVFGLKKAGMARVNG